MEQFGNNNPTDGTPIQSQFPQQSLLSQSPGLNSPYAANTNTQLQSTQMQQQNLMQTPMQQTQPAPMQQQPQAMQSIENNALSGNKQQVSNFMSALNNVNAGTNNAFMHSQNPQVQNVQNLVNPNVVGSTNAMNSGNTMSGNVQQPIQSTPNTQNSQPTIQPPHILPATQYQPTPISPQSPSTSLPQAPQPSSSPYAPALLPQPAPTPSYGPALLPQVPQPTKPTTSAYSSLPQYQSSPYTTALLPSDENLKTNISDGSNDINDFLSKINAHSYTYKDKQFGEGTFTSPMAQELEKTKLGKQAVIDTPKGKMVDYSRLSAVNLAAVSVVHRENEKLQKQINILKSQFKAK